MGTRGITLRCATREELRRVHDEQLRAGGVFVPGITGVAERDRCRLSVVSADTGATLELEGVATWVVAAGPAAGVGFALIGDVTELAAALDAFMDGERGEDEHGEDGHDDGDGDGDGDGGERRTNALHVHERLRSLTPVQQRNVARDGDVNERTVLERIYGKTVWETLLRNPRLTMPEVARIARMPALPRPLIEIILGNTAWLRSPQVRRALLSNTRLTREAALKVLRLTPKHELKLVPTQTAYPNPVRDVARKLLK